MTVETLLTDDSDYQHHQHHGSSPISDVSPSEAHTVLTVATTTAAATSSPSSSPSIMPSSDTSEADLQVLHIGLAHSSSPSRAPSLAAEPLLLLDDHHLSKSSGASSHLPDEKEHLVDLSTELDHAKQPPPPPPPQAEYASSLDGGAPREPTPLPKMRLFVLCVMLLTDGISFHFLLPFIGFMVVDLGVVESKEEAGYYAGLLASSFGFAQFLSSLFWGKMSDIQGRRPVLLLGLASTVVCTVIFGTAQSFAWALTIRTAHGLLNGNTGVVKTYLAEITDSSNRAKAFSIFGLCGGAGRIVGPMIGGLLSRPAIQYPAFFSHEGLFGRFPYLLPCIVSSLVTLAGLVAGFFFLHETLKSKIKREQEEEEATVRAQLHEEVEIELLEVTTGAEPSGSDASNSNSSTEVVCESDSQLSKPSLHGMSINVVHADELTDEQPELVHEQQRRRCCVPWYTRMLNACRPAESTSDEPTACSLLTHREVILPLIAYGVLAMMMSVYDEVFALWALSKNEIGGLGYQEKDIGLAQAAGGSVLIAYQLLVYSRLVQRLGVTLFFRITSALLVPVFLVFPNVSYLYEYSTITWIALLVGLMSRYIVSNSAFTTVFVLSSNGTPSAHLGFINGLGQTFASLTRSVGPAGGGALYAITANSGLPFPFDYRFTYLVISLLAGFNFVVAMFIPRSLDMDEEELAEKRAAEKRAAEEQSRAAAQSSTTVTRS